MVYGHIYKIENLVNNKIYIGQTIQTPSKRKNKHLYDLRQDNHPNSYLQNAYNKYGESNFTFAVLNYATNKETLDQLEKDYINYYFSSTREKGYNLQLGGSSGKHSPETIKKLSEKTRGKNHPFYGKKLPLKTRQKMSKSRIGEKNPNYGKKHSISTRKKISNAIKGENHPCYGKNHSLKHRINIGQGRRGKSLFGFTSAAFSKRSNPEKKCWGSSIHFKGFKKSLGRFYDPLSCEIVHDIVFNEIYRGG